MSTPPSISHVFETQWGIPPSCDLFHWDELALEKLQGRLTPLMVRVVKIVVGEPSKTHPGRFPIEDTSMEWLESTFGGGQYDVRVVDRKNKYTIQERIRIEGPPKVDVWGEMLPPQPMPPMMPPVQAHPRPGTPAGYMAIADVEAMVKNAVAAQIKQLPPDPLRDAQAAQINREPLHELIQTLLVRVMDNPQAAAPTAYANPSTPPGAITLTLPQMFDLGKLIIPLVTARQNPGGGLQDIIKELSPVLETLAPGFSMLIGAASMKGNPEGQQKMAEAWAEVQRNAQKATQGAAAKVA